MDLFALVVAVVALVVALAARSRAGGFGQRIADAESDAKRRTENAADELREALDTTRRLLVELAEGRALDEDMIVEGRLWREVDGAEARRLVDDEGARVLDVRTPREMASGAVAGALRVPLDELEARRAEIPRDGRPMVIYCAAGARSAAACEYLTQQGWTRLNNLEGGFGAWTGPTEVPS